MGVLRYFMLGPSPLKESEVNFFLRFEKNMYDLVLKMWTGPFFLYVP